MKCEFCDEDATVHLTQVLNQETYEMHLCERCAEERGITDPAGFSLPKLLGGKEEQVKLPELKNVLSCADCGFGIEDLKKVGRLGCPKCYKVFEDEIHGMLDTMHRGVKHTGKQPEGAFDYEQQLEVIAEVKNELEIAIKGEDFEQAAKLRDQIKELETQG